MSVLLLDLVCNKALSALEAQAITYYNVFAGRAGVTGMAMPMLPETPFLQRHHEHVALRGPELLSLGRDGHHMRVGASRFAGTMARSEDGNWRDIEPFTLTPDGTAIVHVIGALVNRGAYVGASSGVTSYEGIDYSLQRAANDKRVKAIVLDISSPGGEAAGNDEIARKIIAIREQKPVYGIAGGLAASAGYCILAACTEAYGTSSSLIGSIGCIMLHLDKTEQAKNEGVVPTIIYAGAHKADGHAFQSLTPAALAELKAGVTSYYELFVKTVGAGRGAKLTAKMARDTEAATFVGKEAKTAGLLDDLATFEQVLSASDGEIRRKSRRAATPGEGSRSMSTLVAQMLGGAAPAVASGPEGGGNPPVEGAQFINGMWYAPIAAGQPAAPPAPPAPQPTADPRIGQALSHPTVLGNPQIQGTVLGILRQDASVSADMAIGMAVMQAAAQRQAPQQHQTPPAYPQPQQHQHQAQPTPEAAGGDMPADPPGYHYAKAANGTLYLVSGARPTALQGLAARAAATGAGALHNLGSTPGGVPAAVVIPGQPGARQAAGHAGVDPDAPGSITVERAAAGWDRVINAANGARAHAHAANATYTGVQPDQGNA